MFYSDFHTYPRKSIGDIAEAIKDGTHGTHARVTEGLPLLSAKNISPSGTIVWDAKDSFVSAREFELIARQFPLRAGDLLITIVGSLGRRALYDGSRVVFQRSVAFVRSKGGDVTPKFLFHATGNERFQRQLVQRSNATAQAGLYLGELAKTHIPLPDVPAQKRIAEILDTLDDAIRNTERVIGKLRHIKQGLLHDLLTRGLDDNGELRDPDRHPLQFRDTGLGRLPKRWVPKILTDVVSYQNGSPFPSADYCSDGVKLLRPGNIRTHDFVVWDERHTIHLPLKWKKLAKDFLVGPDEIVMNLTAQSLDDEFLGRVCLTPSGPDCLLNQRIARFFIFGCDKHFFFWFCKSRLFRRQIDRLCQGTKVQHLYNRNLNNLWVPVPESRDEQISIAATLFSVSKRIENEEIAGAKLLRLKQGLMDDLLTGHVRVTNLIAKAA